MAGKIAELKFEAPLARFEEEDTASLKNMNLLTGANARDDTLFVRFPSNWLVMTADVSPRIGATSAWIKVYRDVLESGMSLCHECVVRQVPKLQAVREAESHRSLNTLVSPLRVRSIDSEPG